MLLTRTGDCGVFDRLYTGFVNATQSTVVNLAVRRKSQGYHGRVPPASEDLLSLLTELDLNRGDLWWGPMAMFPWKAEIIIREVVRDPPNLLLDVGAGTSSRLFAALGKKYHFRVTTLENYGPAARSLRDWLEANRMADVVTVQHCALIRRKDYYGRRYRWYNADLNAAGGKFDFVFIDGPVSSLAGRYGALPEISEFLAIKHRIFLDDYTRAHEREVVRDWKRRYPRLQIVPIEGVDGLIELQVGASMSGNS